MSIVTCRYMRRNGEQCTAEAIDPDGLILICAKHAGRVMVMVKARMRLMTRAAPTIFDPHSTN